ncbi:hypothetical protein [Clostridium perfringens]|uniref:hypothetical protein n=1 Tax=Clostridium perfringens TaxID=1502 RepID=UPI001FA7518D|nr:hypothetical protein [Clostridium perfringens]
MKMKLIIYLHLDKVIPLLNENEINTIPTFGQGDTTLIINGMNNITFHVEISEEEKILFEGGV